VRTMAFKVPRGGVCTLGCGCIVVLGGNNMEACYVTSWVKDCGGDFGTCGVHRRSDIHFVWDDDDVDHDPLASELEKKFR
jgi:hypothetical protein